VILPTSGRVTFQGETITGLAPHALVEKGLVRTFQATTVWTGCTVRENALRGAFRHLYPGFFATFFDTARAKEMRAKANAVVDDLLASLSLTEVADQIADSLPYGYQKTLGMVIALAAEPRLVLLDEPAAGLSAEEADHVRDTILKVRQRGISVVVIDHNMRFIKGLCDRVLVIHQGRQLAVGKPTEVLANAKVIEAYLGTYDAAPQG
jgi:branched-chain amino acid transport system ATP-binding protein